MYQALYEGYEVCTDGRRTPIRYFSGFGETLDDCAESAQREARREFWSYATTGDARLSLIKHERI